MKTEPLPTPSSYLRRSWADEFRNNAGSVAVALDTVLYVWELRRGEEEWMGALLIAAPDETTARNIFKTHSRANNAASGDDSPYKAKKMADVFAGGEPRVIYEDEAG